MREGSGDGLTLRGRRFVWGQRTYIMGIVNVTPDSFSGDGLADSPDTAVALAASMADEGADLVDVGGESTRPGSEPISAKEERDRILPVIEGIRRESDLPVSVDTYKAEVAAAALEAGADLVNDVWGLRMDPQMASLVAERDVPLILMHNRSEPKNAAQSERLGGRYVGIAYGDLMGDIQRELAQSVGVAREAGVRSDRIVVDPGIGFGKTVEQNLELLDRLAEIRSLGHPVLVGPSRKSFIGYTLDLSPEDRLEGSAAAVALAIDRGADLVRVHDVRPMVRVARMTDAIVRRKMEVTS
ncbi:MAG: dihydropteroate synthase [Anaerolineae bacterium]